MAQMIVDVVFDFGGSADLDDYDGRTYDEVLRGETPEQLARRLDAICRCQDVLATLPDTTDAQTDALQAEWDMVSAAFRRQTPRHND